jgi:DNA-binding SARP family transcriptional activator
MLGDSARLNATVEAIGSDQEVPPALHGVARSWRQLLGAVAGGNITDAVRLLEQLEADQLESGLHYFRGVTLHNKAFAELARANYSQARDIARAAIEELGHAEDTTAITSSTKATEAAAIAEMGEIEDGLRMANASAIEPSATADAIADAAYLHAVCGRTGRAASLLARFERGDSRWAREIGSEAQGYFARIAFHMAEGRFNDAAAAAAELALREPQAIDARSRLAVVVATLALVNGESDAIALSRRAIEACSQQQAWRWMARARILDAAARQDGNALALWICEVEDESAIAVLELADAIGTAIGLLVPLPEALERSMLREPSRWVPALGRQVKGPPSENSAAAASLVARFGTADDARLLRDYDRLSVGRSRRPGYAAQLIRRVSPAVRVHDLGLTSYEIGGRRVLLTETRRRSAALLLYLVTRPGLAATREQVMESLWPDQSPKSAMNSLHQTIFFLRRDIEPWYEDGSTAGYVHLEGELVRLDADLFHADSIAFARQAAEILATRTAVTRGPGLLSLYSGHFAPEFEYEEWAADWRANLHTTFLRLAHATSDGLLSDGRYGEVVDVLVPVIAIDPTAYELRGLLVACLSAVGATDAAQAQYRSLAAAYEGDLGLPMRPYDEVISVVKR